jgi:hypothetical protein
MTSPSCFPSRKAAENIRRDLDLVFPNGGYTLTWEEDQPLRLSWDEGVHADLRRFSEEIVRLHCVPFETVTTTHQKKPPGRSHKKTGGGSGGSTGEVEGKP